VQRYTPDIRSPKGSPHPFGTGMYLLGHLLVYCVCIMATEVAVPREIACLSPTFAHYWGDAHASRRTYDERGKAALYE